MRFLLLFIFFINIFFYSFLILKPLNLETEFSILEGNNLGEIFKKLEEKNIYFPKVIKLIFNISGVDKKLYLGKYKIKKNDSLHDIFKKIFYGKIVLKKFIVPEGSKINDLFSQEIINKFCLKLKSKNNCELEGFIKPDVYLYDREDELLNILKTSYKHQNIILNEAWEKRKTKLNKFSKKDILIIASILEKESCANERKKISGVIYNRLKENMLLQMDSTTIYGLKNFKGDLKKSHLKDSSLYNTYMHKGLPPGPISNPSLSSLIAAGQPEMHEYLYFVANGKCSHKFSTNYEDHLKAIDQFQLNR